MFLDRFWSNVYLAILPSPHLGLDVFGHASRHFPFMEFAIFSMWKKAHGIGHVTRGNGTVRKEVTFSLRMPILPIGLIAVLSQVSAEKKKP